MKKKHLFLAALAIVLVLCSSIGTAIAYFTTYTGANGGYVIHLGHKSVIHDVYTDVKEISIQNVADSADDVGKYPIFVRAQVFHGNDSIVSVNLQESPNWTEAHEGNITYYYFGSPLYADLAGNYPSAMSTTSTLKIKVDPNPEADLKPGDLVDVVVTYQSVPAVFNTGGLPDMGTSWQNAAEIHTING